MKQTVLAGPILAYEYQENNYISCCQITSCSSMSLLAE